MKNFHFSGLPGRVFYTLRMSRRHRTELVRIRRQHACDSVLALMPQELYAQGIRALALDFDGVLGADGEMSLSVDVEAWLDECIRIFGVQQVFILSNKPLPARIAYFANRYPGVICVRGVAKKPYPEGLQQIVTYSGVAPHSILMVDDRLLTGVLAACIVGCRAMYVLRPYMDFQRRPLHEIFFMLLRSGERWLVK